MSATYRRSLRGNDEGVVLIIALIVVTTVALVTGVTLTRSEGSLRTTIALRNVAATNYAADGAAQVALNSLRTGYWAGDPDAKPAGWAFNNADYDGCFGHSVVDESLSVFEPISALELPEFYPASKSSGAGETSAYVHCVAESFTGSQGTEGGVGGGNQLNHAFFGTGTDDPYGLQTTTDGNPSMPLSIDGPVQVNSPTNSSGKDAIEVASGDADVVGPNANNCTGNGLNVDTAAGYDRDCDSGTKTTPALTPVTTDVPELQVLSTSKACVNRVMIFEPGYYDDVKALNTLTAKCDLAWFQPGVYYFDFHNDQAMTSGVLNDPLAGVAMTGNQLNIWELDSKVMGGTWAGGTGAPPSTVELPGGCVDPRDTVVPELGVQFIFGGDSRMLVDADAEVEICGSYAANRPPIALYGYQGDDDLVRSELTGVGTGMTTNADAVATAAGTHGTFVGGSRSALESQSSGTALWSRTSSTGSTQTRTLQMSGFEPSSEVPKGAVLVEARAVVRHKNTGTASDAATLRIAPAVTGATALAALNLDRPATLTTQTVDLETALGAAEWNKLTRDVHNLGYTGATLTYGAKLPTGSTASPQIAEVDFVRLEFEYYLPQMRGVDLIEGNCVPTVGGCDQIESAENGQGSMLVQGTTFLPDGRIDVRIKNNRLGWRFGWGLVARAFIYDANGSSADVDQAIIDLPDANPGTVGQRGTNVRITVYVCEDQPSCDAASGEKALNVRAQLWDEDPENVVAGQRTVNILSWSHLR